MKLEINLLEFWTSFHGMVWLFYLVLNLFALLAMLSDKRKAIDQEKRTPEGKLMFWAIAFGALGVLIGMWWFRHKINTWYFYLGVPLAVVENLIVLKYFGII